MGWGLLVSFVCFDLVKACDANCDFAGANFVYAQNKKQ